MWRRSLTANARAWPKKLTAAEPQAAAGRPLMLARGFMHGHDLAETLASVEHQRRFLRTRSRSAGKSSTASNKTNHEEPQPPQQKQAEIHHTAIESMVDVSKTATAPVLNPRTTEWIPPNRPLVGDKGESYLYAQQHQDEGQDSDDDEDEPLMVMPENISEAEELRLLEQAMAELERKEALKRQRQEERRRLAQQAQQQPDWLKLRREKLGATVVDGQLTPSYQRPGQELPVVHHTLLRAEEIMTFLQGLGGMNVHLIKDYPVGHYGDSRMGGIMKGMIFVTASSNAHLTLMADALVEQLKRRKLYECGVDAARLGPEGSRDPDETWMVVDCYNYAVHILDERTRRYLKLEELWSKPHPLAYADPNDEKAEEDYLDANPVPAGYGRAGAVDWTETINKLEHQRLTAPHKVVVKRPIRRQEKGQRKANKWR